MLLIIGGGPGSPGTVLRDPRISPAGPDTVQLPPWAVEILKADP
ncbi:MAG: hypothetical protein ACRDY1_03305 [Acidimicrobiales bacterium]